MVAMLVGRGSLRCNKQQQNIRATNAKKVVRNKDSQCRIWLHGRIYKGLQELSFLYLR